MKYSKTAISSLVALGLILTATIGWFVVLDADSPGASDRERSIEPVSLGSGLDLVASESSKDWVENSDLVAVVTVVSEKDHATVESDTKRGEGYIGRDATLRIDEIVWSRLDSDSVPRSITMAVAGWVFNAENYEGKRKFSFEGTPRLEVDHQYVVALAWRDAITPEMVAACGGGDDKPESAHWASIGQFGLIPFDGGALGSGEFEGRVRTLAEAREAVEQEKARSGSLPLSFRDAVTGTSLEAVRAQLDALGATTKRVPEEKPDCRKNL